MAQGIGFGKVILFGEHFVAHGGPAITLPTNERTLVEAKIIPGNKTRIIAVGKGHNRKRLNLLVETAKKQMSITENVEIRIRTELFIGVGMGSSAAASVATVRALSNLFKQNRSNEEINQIAYEIEKIFHGNPSGIDNTIATYGKPIWFKKNMKGGPNIVSLVNQGKPLRIVIGVTPRQGTTARWTKKVRKFKARKTRKFKQLMDDAKKIAERGRKALETGQVGRLGVLMSQNHRLLQKLGVSTPALDNMTRICLRNGALGAKLTGAGGGGCVIALAGTEKTQQNIQKALAQAGYQTKTKLPEVQTIKTRREKRKTLRAKRKYTLKKGDSKHENHYRSMRRFRY